MKRSLPSIVLVIAIMSAGLLSRAQLKEFKPVTEAMLANPDPEDWINWRRTRDAWGYSPLKQITNGNVHRLQLVWSFALDPGMSQPAPLVYNGVMYISSPNNGVHALNAVTGDLIWEYKKEAPPHRAGINRNLAIYGDRIYFGTSDAHLIALDVRTGAVVWDRTVADHKLGYTYTSGPIIVKGRIVAGLTGCQLYKNDVCFISAHDAETGKELWRTATIAAPGEPGGDTWGDLPLMFRAGGDMWIPGSYDSKANLIFWATAQAKPWTRFQRGTTGDALYTNSVLALEPETGKIVWFNQLLPGETHDMDEVFENILIDYEGRTSLFKMGKLGILWELDRKSGKTVAAHDLGYQNLVKIDPKTVKVTYRPEMIPQPGVEIDMCPIMSGLKSWRAMAYHPETHAFYIPLQPACIKATWVGDVEKTPGGGGEGGPAKRDYHFHPASPEHLGDFVAMDIKSGEVLWRRRTRNPMGTAVLTTAGGLVIVGGWDGHVYAHDAKTGKILFQTRLPTSTHGFPMTYAVNGKQYIAVPVGAESWAPWVNNNRVLTPEQKAPARTNAVYVFALPDERPL